MTRLDEYNIKINLKNIGIFHINIQKYIWNYNY